MKISARLTVAVVALALLGMCLTGCAKKKKKGHVIVKNYKFVLRHDTKDSFAVDAEGTIQNDGDVDVKNVVVTGYCRSCGQMVVNGRWFVSDYAKTPDQKDVISYLPKGAQAKFKFKGVAFMMEQSGQKPASLPKKMEIVIESFETVQ